MPAGDGVRHHPREEGPGQHGRRHRVAAAAPDPVEHRPDHRREQHERHHRDEQRGGDPVARGRRGHREEQGARERRDDQGVAGGGDEAELRHPRQARLAGALRVRPAPATAPDRPRAPAREHTGGDARAAARRPRRRRARRPAARRAAGRRRRAAAAPAGPSDRGRLPGRAGGPACAMNQSCLVPRLTVTGARRSPRAPHHPRPPVPCRRAGRRLRGRRRPRPRRRRGGRRSPAPWASTSG